MTQKSLEEQLLGKVIGREQKALEDQLNQVLEEVNSNTKALLQLDAMLLEQLTSKDGNLLEDEELIGVLGNTKARAVEVKSKLTAADETPYCRRASSCWRGARRCRLPPRCRWARGTRGRWPSRR